MTETPDAPLYLPAGDTALVVQFGEQVDRALNRRVRRLGRALAEAGLGGIVDIVPTMRSLMVHYDPLATSHAELAAAVAGLLEAGEDAVAPHRRWRVPVCYEGAHAPDIAEVAAALGVTPAEVARRHTAAPMEVFMMGFLPGFPYLGVLPEAFDLPRRAEPRVKVPARSISVAARQTTVYTIESPGGWHLIGRTPVDFFDPARAEPILVAAGDEVWFEAVDAAAYDAIRRAVERGAYEVPCETVEDAG